MGHSSGRAAIKDVSDDIHTTTRRRALAILKPTTVPGVERSVAIAFAEARVWSDIMY